MAGGEVEVVDVLGVDVGDAPPVPDDLHRLPKASQLEASFNLGRAARARSRSMSVNSAWGTSWWGDVGDAGKLTGR